MIEDFFGNRAAVETLQHMIAEQRIPQTLLFSGPEGAGKATLARRFGAAVLGGREKIEQDDLSLPKNADYITEREKLAPDKRNDDPLLFASHPDFVTFAPDGPLRQITIQQIRLLKERAQFRPTKGARRIFLIDQIDRANEQAANSLLKTLEEPPEYLILIMTAANPYDLLPTIRSRAVSVQLSPLGKAEMQEFARSRGLDHAERRVALAQGSPGLAVSLDLEAYDRRRAAMLTLLEVAAGMAPFANWIKFAEGPGSRTEKLEPLLRVLYTLLSDILALQHGGREIRNPDVRDELAAIAGKMSFDWLRKAVRKTDELAENLRRNIQKNIALDDLIVELSAQRRPQAPA